MARARGHHRHEATKHRHKHYHVTHYLHRGEDWGTYSPHTPTITTTPQWSMSTSRIRIQRRSIGVRLTCMTTVTRPGSWALRGGGSEPATPARSWPGRCCPRVGAVVDVARREGAVPSAGGLGVPET